MIGRCPSRRTATTCSRAIIAGALTLVCAPLAAQAVEQYRLPTPAPAPSAPVIGPLDPAMPAPSPARTIATPVIQPVPPRTVPSAYPSAQAGQRNAPAAARPVPRPVTRPVTRPVPAGQARAPALPPPAPSGAPAAQAKPDVPPAPTSTPHNPAPQTGQSGLPVRAFGAGVLLIMLASAGLILWFRRKSASRSALSAGDPPEALQATTTPTPSPTAEAASSPRLVITLEAQRLTASLMATTVHYVLRVTNTGPAAIATLAIEADLVAAHASLPVDEQLADAQRPLELRHAHVDLPAGQSIEFRGDLRLPLSAITPIRAGHAAYFVPLVRLRAEASTPGLAPVIVAQTYVLGEQGETTLTALRPFRLDQGPRTFSQIGQRPVT